MYGLAGPTHVAIFACCFTSLITAEMMTQIRKTDIVACPHGGQGRADELSSINHQTAARW